VGNGQSPVRTDARMNYGLLLPSRMQPRTIARIGTPTRCLRFYCELNLLLSQNTLVKILMKKAIT